MMCGLAVLGLTINAAFASGGTEGCCPPRDVRLSAREMKARLRHTVPVSPLALGKDVRIKGTVVFVVGIDRAGSVGCIRLVSGRPMLVATAMDSVKHWKFQADAEPTCDKLVLALSTLERDMGLRVLEMEPRYKRP